MDNIFDFNLASPPEICNALGQRLRARRLAAGWSQSDLARRAGLSAGTVKNLELKGQASLDSFIHIVSALGLAGEMGELFTIRLVSIAAMEEAEYARRQRAPRRTAR